MSIKHRDMNELYCHSQIGLFSSGTKPATIMSAPENTPADPIPAIVLPKISATEVGAAPHSAEPTSKRKIAKMKTCFGEAKVYALPKTSWKEQVVNR